MTQQIQVWHQAELLTPHAILYQARQIDSHFTEEQALELYRVAKRELPDDLAKLPTPVVEQPPVSQDDSVERLEARRQRLATTQPAMHPSEQPPEVVRANYALAVKTLIEKAIPIVAGVQAWRQLSPSESQAWSDEPVLQDESLEVDNEVHKEEQVNTRPDISGQAANPEPPEDEEDKKEEKQEKTINQKELERLIKDYLGDDFEVKTNESSDKIFISKDGTRKVRFDIKNSHNEKPHIHFEKLNGKGTRWVDAFHKHRFIIGE